MYGALVTSFLVLALVTCGDKNEKNENGAAQEAPDPTVSDPSNGTDPNTDTGTDPNTDAGSDLPADSEPVPIVSIETGNNHTCALLREGEVKCWGYGDFGRLGQGGTDSLGDGEGEMGGNLRPIDLGASATSISAGGRHTCALLSDGKVKCWGRGENGQLGQGGTDNLGDDNGEMGDKLHPIDLGGVSATSISAGGWHTCALLRDGEVKCWGSGENGQLGQGNTDNLGDDNGEMGDDLPHVDILGVGN